MLVSAALFLLLALAAAWADPKPTRGWGGEVGGEGRTHPLPEFLLWEGPGGHCASMKQPCDRVRFAQDRFWSPKVGNFTVINHFMYLEW